MAIYRANLAFQYDSALPRDAISINPHFFGDNPDALATALMTNLKAVSSIGAACPIRIRIYDAQKAPPSYPLAEKVNGSGFVATGSPRELALCLSYYSTWNRPRYRGRLYLPKQWVGGAIDLRPTGAQMTAALNFRSVFSTGMPPSHNWVVYSELNDQAYGVSNVWVDDEWDIVRSRGLRGTTRQTAEFP